MPPDVARSQKRDYLVSYHGRHDPGRQGGRGQEDRRHPDFKQQARLHPQQAADGGAAAARSQGRRHRRRRMHKVYDDAIKQMAPEQEVHARHILIRVAADDEKASKDAEDKVKAVIARLKKGEDFAKVAERGRPRTRPARPRRRSRLLHQGPDGAGIRRRRLQARQGPDLRAGEDPVRLARHQGRGQAHEAGRRRSTRSSRRSRTIVARKAQAELVAKLRAERQDRALYDEPSRRRRRPPQRRQRRRRSNSRSNASTEFVMAGACAGHRRLA